MIQSAMDLLVVSDHPIFKYHDTDVAFLCWLPPPAFLEEDKGPGHDVLAAASIGGRGRVDAGGVERPARDGAVGVRLRLISSLFNAVPSSRTAKLYVAHQGVRAELQNLAHWPIRPPCDHDL